MKEDRSGLMLLPFIMNTGTRKELEGLVEETIKTLGQKEVTNTLKNFLAYRRVYEEHIENPPNPRHIGLCREYDTRRDNYALIQTKQLIRQKTNEEKQNEID